MISQRKKFSLPTGSIYLNGAYMSPLLKAVEKAGMEGIKKKRNPAGLPAEAFFKGSIKLREEFARIIKAKESSRIAIISSASYGLANVARNCKIDRSQNVVVAAEQFPSNVYPW